MLIMKSSTWTNHSTSSCSGNRWIHSLWVVTPHKNPPLDLSELKPANNSIVYPVHHEYPSHPYPSQGTYYPESVPGDFEAQFDSRLGTPQPQEYMELHKRESEIWSDRHQSSPGFLIVQNSFTSQVNLRRHWRKNLFLNFEISSFEFIWRLERGILFENSKVEAANIFVIWEDF